MGMLAPVINSILTSNATGVPTWASTISVVNGGTGRATLTTSAILYGNGTGAISMLAPVNSSILTSSATGVPTWASTLPVINGGTGLSTIPANALMYGSGSGTVGVLNSVNNSVLTTDGTGLLSWASSVPVQSGGTGLSTIPSGSVLIGNGTSAISTVSNVNNALFVGGSSTPAYNTALYTLLNNSTALPTANTIAMRSTRNILKSETVIKS